MEQYHELIKYVLKNGEIRENRTKIQTKGVFGFQTKYDLSKGFPLLTTKKVNFHAIKTELLWFIKGDTNIKFLIDNNVNIWNEWPYDNYKKSSEYKNETFVEFMQKLKKDNIFAEKWGQLGPVYGKQWRDFNGIDQLTKLIQQIKNNPNSRRLIISAWNPQEVDDMLLPPCHTLFQFYVTKDKRLSCQLYQRSADIFLGVPFNIASYSLLVFLLAHCLDLKVGEFVHTLGDAHIYVNHINQVNLQITRTPKQLPTLKINKNKKDIFDFEIDDIEIENYNPDPFIKGEVAV